LPSNKEIIDVFYLVISFFTVSLFLFIFDSTIINSVYIHDEYTKELTWDVRDFTPPGVAADLELPSPASFEQAMHASISLFPDQTPVKSVIELYKFG
jgi:hypothetical protein